MSAPEDPIRPDEFGLLLAPLGAAAGIVAAVSGGPDSTALMRALAGWQRQGARPLVVAATVDHGLRPGSRQEAETVAAWAEAAGLPHRILPWQGPKPRSRIQETARAERYRLLAACAREVGASHVATAHTLDDQAETVLMRLTRGTGVAGLAGMRPVSQRDGITLARPFLDLRKSRLVATCRAEGWPFLEDPSNVDPRFLRARLRRLMPLLAKEGLTAERLAVLARRASRVEEAVDARAWGVLAAIRIPAGERGLVLDGATLAAEPDAIFLGVVARAIVEVVGAATRPVRLERWEGRVLEDLRRALARGERLRMTLGGALLDLGPEGRLVVAPEPERRPRGPRPRPAPGSKHD